VEALRTLYEDPGESAAELPEQLAALYGGGLPLSDDAVYANFVSSLDGVVSLGGRRGSGSAISGRDRADRFVMGLLRASADAILVGAGTLRAEGGQPWTASWISPDHASAYAALGRPDPLLVVATASGELDPGEPALEMPTLVVTTAVGAERLRGQLPATVRVRALPPTARRASALRGHAILAAIRAEGGRRVLLEGGPRMAATLVAEDLLDDLFLTLSPVLAGRRTSSNGGEARPGLLEGTELLPRDRRWTRLSTVKRHGSHLFLHYRLSPTEGEAGGDAPTKSAAPATSRR
jgi:riboflavin biosynthesis pyrimidine reductase